MRRNDALMRAGAAILAICALSCYTASPEEQARTAKAQQDCPGILAASRSVRITSNNDVVKGCKYLGNVKGHEFIEDGPVINARLTPDLCFFAGAKGAVHTADEVIRFSTAQLGGDTVQVTGSGDSLVGEAYRCSAQTLGSH